MNRHLFSLPAILRIGIALVHELVQSEPAVHQHAFKISIEMIADNKTTKRDLNVEARQLKCAL